MFSKALVQIKALMLLEKLPFALEKINYIFHLWAYVDLEKIFLLA